MATYGAVPAMCGCPGHLVGSKSPGDDRDWRQLAGTADWVGAYFNSFKASRGREKEGCRRRHREKSMRQRMEHGKGNVDQEQVDQLRRMKSKEVRKKEVLRREGRGAESQGDWRNEEKGEQRSKKSGS